VAVLKAYTPHVNPAYLVVDFGNIVEAFLYAGG
jgi:hypothetical protein